MTKAELIRKISKHSGIPDSEAKIFFEIFLQKASEILKPSEVIKIKNVGYFQLREAEFKTAPEKHSGKINQVRTNVLVFFPFDRKANEDLIFNIPLRSVEKYDPVDSYFSLSIGKPVIPLQGAKEYDYFISPGGYEMKKLIDSKVDKLLNYSEIIRDYVQGKEVLIIGNVSPGNRNNEQIELDWNTGNLITKKNNRTSENSNVNTKYHNVSWDFGEDIKRQIEEESIIESSSETDVSSIESSDTVASLTWNFGEQPGESEKDDREIHFTEQEDISNKKTTHSKTKPEIQNDEIFNEYELVKSITYEFNPVTNMPGTTPIDTTVKGSGLTAEQEKEELSWDFSDELEINDKNVKRKDETLEFEEDQKIESETTGELINETSAGDEDNLTLPVSPIEHIDNETTLESSPAGTTLNKDANLKTKTREYKYSRNRSILPFIFAMATIIMVSAAVFIYISKINLSEVAKKLLNTPGPQVSGVRPSVIERSFEIPVTYPYPKVTQQKYISNEINGNILLSGGSNNAVDSLQPKSNLSTLLNGSKKTEKVNAKKIPVENKKTAPVPNRPVGQHAGVIGLPTLKGTSGQAGLPTEQAGSEKIKDNIYKHGNEYIVQLSSWQSKAKADNELLKYQKRGFTSYIEKAEIAGKGTWYRIKVGNFKNLEEAQKFADKNK